MSVFGAIDLGSNSVRLLIAEVREGGIIPRVNALQTTRIGEGMGHSGQLLTPAITRTIKALEDYQRLLQEHGTEQYRLVATSAVREAENKQDLVERIQQIGLHLEIISGEEEAQLGYTGATRGLLAVTQPPIVLDIGGGSTECTWLEPSGLQGYSLPLGAVRLMENPQLAQNLPQSCQDFFRILRTKSSLPLVGVGGTITTLAAIDLGLTAYQPDKIQGYGLTYENIQSIYQRLKQLSEPDRRNLPGLQPERADIILFGINWLLMIMEEIEQKEIRVSDHDLLQGLIWSMEENKENENHFTKIFGILE